MKRASYEALSESVDWKLTQTLLNQQSILISGGLSQMMIAAFGFVRTGLSWFVWLGVAAFVVVAARLMLNAAFVKSGQVRAFRPTVWRRRFLIGTCASGAVCGLGGFGSVLTTDAFTQLLVITLLTSFVMGSAARNGVYPEAAIGSVLFAEGPLLIACLITRNGYYICYTFFIVMFTLSSMAVVRHLYEQTVRFFVTDEKNVELVREVSQSNSDLAATNEKFAAANDQLAAANEKLAAMASTDGLTGIANRRSFDVALETEARAAKRDGSELSLVMFDIDHFKKYNDRYGHQAGDECLRRVAAAFAKEFRRPRDLAARYGGEEFAAVLPQTDLRGARTVAENVRAAIEALQIEHLAADFGYVTVSIGVATISFVGAATGADLLRRADQALYIAKEAGRNCVRCANEECHVDSLTIAPSPQLA